MHPVGAPRASPLHPMASKFRELVTDYMGINTPVLHTPAHTLSEVPQPLGADRAAAGIKLRARRLLHGTVDHPSRNWVFVARSFTSELQDFTAAKSNHVLARPGALLRAWIWG